MSGNEVLNQAVVMLLEVCQQRGISGESLTHGLSVTPEALRQDRWGRMSWDEYTVVLERLEGAVGGLWQLESLCCDMVESHRTLRLLARLLLNSKHPPLEAGEHVVRRYYQDIGYRARCETDGRVRLEFSIPAHLRACPQFGYGTSGAIRACPRLFENPYSIVDCDISPRHSVFLVSPPATRAVVSRASDQMADWPIAPWRGGDGEAAPADDMLDAVSLAFDNSSQTSIANLIGARLVAATGIAELSREIVAVLEQYFCCRHVMLWLTGEDGEGGELTVSHPSSDTQSRMVRPLMVGDRAIGRMEVDLWPLETGAPVPLFEAILPWIAVAVQHANGSGRPQQVQPHPRQIDARVEEATSHWGLTPRQADVLKLLVEGATNKDIAQSLGTTNRTIEVHVTQLLRKAHADNRATLIARFWASGTIEGPSA